MLCCSSSCSNIVVLKEPTQDVPSTEFEKLSIEPQQQQRVGKVRVFSRQMEIERKRREQMRSNKLSGLAGPVFFFPLLVGWWEGAQGLLKYGLMFIFFEIVDTDMLSSPI